MLFANPIALGLQAPPDDVFGCIGIEVTANGEIYPLAAVGMEQAMAEMDPFQAGGDQACDLMDVAIFVGGGWQFRADIDTALFTLRHGAL